MMKPFSPEAFVKLSQTMVRKFSTHILKYQSKETIQSDEDKSIQLQRAVVTAVEENWKSYWRLLPVILPV